MIVVSDTSPLSALLRIGQMQLLPSLYGVVIIPASVRQELEELSSWGYNPQAAFSEPWLEIRQCPHDAFFHQLRLELDEGKSEAIVLSKILKADLLLIDELKGRKIAQQEGLKITGLLGVLLDAKKAGLVSTIKSLVDDLINKANFRIHADLYQRVLALASETS